MKKYLLFSLIAEIIFLSCYVVNSYANIEYADVLYDSYYSGSNSSFNSYYGGTPSNYPVEVNPNVVLGDNDTFLSLPAGTFVIIGFTDNTVVDTIGQQDLFIEEIGGNGEKAEIYVSSNNNDFVFLGIAEDNGITSFDLSDIGFTDPVVAVKILGIDNLGESPGFDLVSVKALAGSIGPAPSINDSDGDGVIDQWDKCSNTPPNSMISSNGCSIEVKGDVNDNYRIGLEEAINALQIVAGVKPAPEFEIPINEWYSDEKMIRYEGGALNKEDTFVLSFYVDNRSFLVNKCTDFHFYIEADDGLKDGSFIVVIDAADDFILYPGKNKDFEYQNDDGAWHTLDSPENYGIKSKQFASAVSSLSGVYLPSSVTEKTGIFGAAMDTTKLLFNVLDSEWWVTGMSSEEAQLLPDIDFMNDSSDLNFYKTFRMNLPSAVTIFSDDIVGYLFTVRIKRNWQLAKVVPRFYMNITNSNDINEETSLQIGNVNSQKYEDYLKHIKVNSRWIQIYERSNKRDLPQAMEISPVIYPHQGLNTNTISNTP